MKKTILGLTLIATLILVSSLTSLVSADNGDPTPQPDRCNFVERIFKSDDCGPGRPDGARLNDGIMHEYMLQLFSDKLGLSVSEIETRLDDGETMSEIAISEGLSVEEYKTWILDACSQAIDQAVKDGKLTTEQAEWMKSHRGVMFGGFDEYGRSGGMMSGRHGRFGGMMFGGFNRPDSADGDGYPDCPNMP